MRMATINVNPVPTFDPHGDPNTCNRNGNAAWLRSFELYSDAAGCDDDRQTETQAIVLCKMFSRSFFANKKLIMMIRKLKFGDVTYNVMN